jgi:hypothetical protein
MAYIGNPPANRFVAPKAATQFSGDGSTTAFTLDHAVGSDEDILVSVDGVIQEPSVAYAVSNGTTLTFTAAPSSNSGNNIFVYYLFRTVGTVGHPSNNALSAANATITGDVTVDTTTLVVDSTNNRVGIGTASPSNKFEVDGGSAETRLRVSTTGTDANEAGIILANSSKSADNDGIEISHGGGYTTFSGLTGTEYMRITGGTGIITKPLQPAFLARPSARQSNLAINTTHTIVFDSEIFDQNADFSSNTFTAPVTGKYQLNVQLLVQQMDNDTDYYSFQLTTSNRNFWIYYDNNDKAADNSNGDGQHIVVLTDMDANDTAVVTVSIPNSGAAQMDVETGSAFSGYLVA